ncbi:MAG TPA: DUF3006 domain-containing protein [Bacillales bacterium]
MAKYRLDHFEKKTVVLSRCDNASNQINIPQGQLPRYVMEGDILELVFLKDGSVRSAGVLHKGIK